MKIPVPADGSLRIGSTPRATSQDPVNESVAGSAGEPSSSAKPYLARLVLLVPAEIVTLYVSLKPLATDFLPTLGVACLLLVLLVRIKATNVGGKPEWGGILVSMISFGLWVYAIGGTLPLIPAGVDEKAVAVAIAIWTFVVPYLYQGGSDAPAANL